jgi:acyl dehydratase
MSLDHYFRIGETITLGSHTFTAEEIKAFASKYDPQRFHVDEAQAKKSVFGRLCASGWHTCAVWMKVNLAWREDLDPRPWTGPGDKPEFGPSPGISGLKWLRPVYVGDTITFARRATGHRPLASRPGWRLLTLQAEAHNQDGEKVLEFDNAVLVKATA